jgi:hypothetical protein
MLVRRGIAISSVRRSWCSSAFRFLVLRVVVPAAVVAPLSARSFPLVAPGALVLVSRSFFVPASWPRRCCRLRVFAGG